LGTGSKREQKIIGAPPENAFDLVPRDLYGDKLNLVKQPKNRETLKELDERGMNRDTVRRIIGDTFCFDTVVEEVLTREHPHYKTGIRIMKGFDKAINVLEKLSLDPGVAHAFRQGTNLIEELVRSLKDERKTLASFFGVMPELYSDEPRPKTVRQMLQFQVFTLHRYMRHVVDSFHGNRGYGGVLTDNRIHALILELLQKIYTHPSYRTQQFDVAKVKELCEVHKLERRIRARLQRFASRYLAEENTQAPVNTDRP
jgi:hypothetical protein